MKSGEGSSEGPTVGDGLIGVPQAARLVRRNPETVRRWVWSGRLVARRDGNRLLLSRADVEALAAGGTPGLGSLAEWAERAKAVRDAGGGRLKSAAGLVLDDRSARSGVPAGRAGR